MTDTTVTAVDVGVLVIGGGGHALVSIEVLRSCGHDVTGCVTRDGVASARLDRLGVKVIGRDSDLDALVSGDHPVAFVAVGDNRARRRLSEAVVAAGGSLPRAVSPDAVISITADIGEGVLVMPGAVVNADARLERGVIVNTHASIDHGCRIGAFAHVAPGVALAGDVNVGEGALIGIGASVVPGRSIGAWATVGAGAVRGRATSLTARRSSACRPVHCGRSSGERCAPNPRGVHREPLPLATRRGTPTSGARCGGHRRRGLVSRSGRPTWRTSRPPAPSCRRRSRCRRRRSPQPFRVRRGPPPSAPHPHDDERADGAGAGARPFRRRSRGDPARRGVAGGDRRWVGRRRSPNG